MSADKGAINGSYSIFDLINQMNKKNPVKKVEDVRDISSAKAKLRELNELYEKMGQAKGEEDDESRAIGDAIEQQQAEIEKFKDMINVFDSSFLLRNIENLAEAADLKMYDVDDMMRVSTGYIAKAAAPDSKRRLSIDVVVKLARLFHVNLDALINADLTAPSKDLKQAIEFITKMKADTEDGKMRWNQYDAGIKQGKADNLLFKLDSKGKLTYAPNGEDSINSATGRIYAAETKVGKLFIIQVEDIIFDTINYEMYLYDEETYRGSIEGGYETLPLTKMCFSEDDGSGLLRAKMLELYNTIVTHERDFVITDDAKGYMDKLMGKTVTSSFIIDDVLPFT